jgi:hypothetical protein
MFKLKSVTDSQIFNRMTHFLGTSPDEAGNRRRLIFFLLLLFCAAIAYELWLDKSTAREDLIKTFSSTITWLVGIYVAGTVAGAKLSPVDPSANANLPATPPTQNLIPSSSPRTG